MRKLVSLLSIALLALTTSCQKDQIDGTKRNGEVNVQISASVPSAPSTYGYANEGGLTKSTNKVRYIMEAWTKDATPRLAKRLVQVEATGTATVRFETRLMAKEYDFLFWADFAGDVDDLYYKTNAALGLNKVSIITTAAKANSLADVYDRDAYCAATSIDLRDTGVTLPSQTLKRPFGRFEWVTTDRRDILPLTDVPTSTKVTYKTAIPSAYNVLAGDVVAEEVIDGRVMEGAIVAHNADNVDLNLGFDYVFAPKAGQGTYEMMVQIFNESSELMNYRDLVGMPIEKNKRTIMTGALLTRKGEVTVEVVDAFDTPDNDKPVGENHTIYIVSVADANAKLAALTGKYDVLTLKFGAATRSARAITTYATGASIESLVLDFTGLTDALEVKVTDIVPVGVSVSNLVPVNNNGGQVTLDITGVTANIAQPDGDVVFDGTPAPAAGYAIAPPTTVKEGLEAAIAQGFNALILGEGNYALNGDIESAGSVNGIFKYYLPIYVDGFKLIGEAGKKVVLYGDEYQKNGAWNFQNLVTVFAKNATIENVTLMCKEEINKVLEVLGANFIMKNCKVVPNSFKDRTDIAGNIWVDADNATFVDNRFEYAGLSVRENRTATLTGNTFVKGSGSSMWYNACIAVKVGGTINLKDNALVDVAKVNADNIPLRSDGMLNFISGNTCNKASNLSEYYWLGETGRVTINGQIFPSPSGMILYSNDFASNVGDWTNASKNSDGTATISFDAFSRSGSYRTTWYGDWTQSLDVYLDPAAFKTGEYSLLTSSANSSTGTHIQDNVFGFLKQNDGIWVKADTGTSGADWTGTYGDDRKLGVVASAGWYTLKWSFIAQDGKLACQMTISPRAGSAMGSKTNVSGLDIASAGANRYIWMAKTEGGDKPNPKSLKIDNHILVVK